MKINVLEKASQLLVGGEIINVAKTRLGGDIIHFKIHSGEEVFIKIGSNFERLEIIREYKNLTSLQGHLPVPKIYDYVVNNDSAIIILQKMPGTPLHSMVSLLGRQPCILIIKDILCKLYDIFEIVRGSLEIATSQELSDIKILIDQDKIKIDKFTENSGRLSPKEAFAAIEKNIMSHNNLAISHGDLCLPNILVNSAGDWSLIDWGKGGIGDHCRDLSSLEGSLRRNIDDNAFLELCEITNIELNVDSQKKIDLYKLIDLFWYNAIL